MKRPAHDDRLIRAVQTARAHRVILTELSVLYSHVDAELGSTGQDCRQCGECCDFERFGHRLYVTPAELALLLESPRPPATPGGRCLYQVDKACTARRCRTLGCRVFSCLGDTGHQCRIYERYHHQIKALHLADRVPYLYVDWGRSMAIAALLASAQA